MFGALFNKTPSSCANSSAAHSAANRSARRSRMRVLERGHEPAQRQLVAGRAEPAEEGPRSGGPRRAPPFWLAGKNIGEVHFDKREGHGRQRVADRQTRVAVGASVDQRAIGTAAERVDGIDERTLAVVLGAVDVDAELRANGRQSPRDVGEGGGAVDRRFSGAEEIQAGAVENRDSHFFFSPDSQLLNCSVSAAGSVEPLAAGPGCSVGASLEASLLLLALPAVSPLANGS